MPQGEHRPKYLQGVFFFTVYKVNPYAKDKTFLIQLSLVYHFCLKSKHFRFYSRRYTLLNYN